MQTIRTDIYNKLIEHSYFLNSSLGQNYLKNKFILNFFKKISREISSDYIVEVGTGAGVLTEVLAATQKKILSYEIDKKIYNIVKVLEKDYSNLKIINQDFLKAELPDKTYSVVANIPYNISTPILKKLLTSINLPSIIIVMVQKEFSQKLVKPPFNAFTFFIHSVCSIQLLKNISKNDFFPRPNVDSVIISLKPDNYYLCDKKYLDFLNRLFNSKRKKISFFLKKEKKFKKMNFAQALLDKRPEKLNCKELIQIYNLFETR
ncbi:MAG: 16S rRNA (adenine(1518)-N(6)/adenine(1519)-N(6))-dimethyltransferase RsmA [Candidatus Muiribacteriota bacterium]